MSSGRTPYFIIPLLDHVSPNELPEVSALQSYLETVSASSILPNPESRPLICIPSTSSIANAVYTLAKNKILAAPVLKEDNICAGIIDTLAIVEFLNHITITHPSSTKPSSIPRRQSLDNSGSEQLNQVQEAVLSQSSVPTAHHSQKHFVMSPEEVSKTPISLILEHSNKQQTALVPFFESNPLYLLLELFGTGIHRVALISASYELKVVCSQSDLIAFLDRLLQSNMFKLLSSVKLEDLPLSHRQIISINETVTVKDAIRTLLYKKVSSLAVTHSTTNALVADFSASILRGLADFRELNLNIIDYLNKFHPNSLIPALAHNYDTLGSIIHQLAVSRAHRVWVLDKDHVPINVFSLTDICRLLSSGRHVSGRECHGDTILTALWRSVPLTARAMETSEDQFKFAII